MKTVIKNAHVISPGVEIEGATVVIEKGRIARVGKFAAPKPKAGDTVVDAKGNYLMPGFIDVHTHGALECDFCDPDPQAVFKLAEGKLQEGCTSFLPTTLTVSHEELIAAAENAKAYVKAGSPYAKILGIHLEGPFINIKCCGAQNPKYVRKPSIMTRFVCLNIILDSMYKMKNNEERKIRSKQAAAEALVQCGWG